MTDHIFSCHGKVVETKTISPSWWAFWRKPKLLEYEGWKRYSILLTEEEKKWVMAHNDYNDVGYLLFIKALTNCGVMNTSHHQLEAVSTNQFTETST